MPFTLVSTDIDDTLVSFGKSLLDEEVIRIFSDLGKKGILVVPNTGRGFHNLPQNLFDANIPYAICSNGSAVYDVKTKALLHSAYIQGDCAQNIFRLFDSFNIPYFCFVEDGSFTNTASYEKLMQHELHRQFAKTLSVTDSLGTYLIRNKKQIEKIVAIFLDGQFPNKERIISSINETYHDLSVTSSNTFNMEINNIHANKALGLQALCTYLHIPLDDVIVTGDNENDISALKIGKYRIVPKNGSVNAKRYADILVDDYTKFGVVKALEDIFKNS